MGRSCSSYMVALQRIRRTTMFTHLVLLEEAKSTGEERMVAIACTTCSVHNLILVDCTRESNVSSRGLMNLPNAHSGRPLPLLPPSE